jgi:phage tail-like protein
MEGAALPTLRDDPYLRFNFLVALGEADPGSVVAGFEECSRLGMQVGVVEYRNGNDRANHVRKLPGLTRTLDVVFRRGLVGAADLFTWIREVRDGVPDRREVTITLLDEQRQPVMVWRLHRAWPSGWTAGPLHAKQNAVAIEELTLVCESIDLE